MNEIVLLIPDRNRQSIINMAGKLELKNVCKYSQDQIQYIYNNWSNMSDSEIGKIIDKDKISVKGKRLSLGLLRTKEESSYNSLSEFVRRNNLDWKKKSIRKCGFKCVLSGERFDAIHHIHGLNLILNETLEELSIDVKESMDDYTDNDLKSILAKFRIIQDKYPLGICLKNDIHKEFHSIYGYGYNTELQWNQYTQNYSSNNIAV